VWQVCTDRLVTRFPKDINVLLLAVLGRTNKKSNTIMVMWLCIVLC
jgi:hypothetical protein